MGNMFENTQAIAFEGMAVMLKNFYDSLIEKGFDREQAMVFTKVFMESSLNQSQEG